MSNTRTIADAEWEVHKNVLEGLYKKGTLLELMALMEQDHNFVASFVAHTLNNPAIKLIPL
jgi:hypothetical protein